MPQDRYFIKQPLIPSDEIKLIDDEAHHLHVMRKNIGDNIEVINGQNILAHAHIVRVEKRCYILSITDVQHYPPPKPLILAQALPRINRLDDIIEKGTELGVTEFFLFPGERSEKKQLRDNDFDRLLRIAISAIKQCGRLDIPKINMGYPIFSLKELSSSTYFGDLNNDAKLFSHVYEDSEIVTFFVGPESGFSSQEIEHLKKLNAKGVRLHPNTLRTNTAPLVALSLIQHWRLDTLQSLR